MSDETVFVGVSMANVTLPDRRDLGLYEDALLKQCRRIAEAVVPVAPSFGVVAGEIDLWRDSGWEVECSIDMWQSAVVVSPIAPPAAEPYLIVLCQSSVGTIGRLLGRSDRLHVIQLVRMMAHVFALLKFSEVRWYRRYRGTWNDAYDPAPPTT